MTDVAIRIDDVSKLYHIKAVQETHASRLRDALNDQIRGWARRLLRPWAGPAPAGAARATRQEFWALRGVSFEVARGEVLGLMGRNGAGKSTLLKVVSRITRPTTGWLSIRGRVVSLLEVGTGFNPDLTGRENVFLNGAIIGMKQREVRRKFDDIVGFAEVGPFIDTPVRFYSTGMYSRLAFAVAVHQDPEVMILDEVLAVGDFAFQQKCLARIHAIARQGCTVLFVSHSTAAVKEFCGKAVLLDAGRVAAWGPTADVVRQYLGAAAPPAAPADPQAAPAAPPQAA